MIIIQAINIFLTDKTYSLIVSQNENVHLKSTMKISALD